MYVVGEQRRGEVAVYAVSEQRRGEVTMMWLLLLQV